VRLRHLAAIQSRHFRRRRQQRLRLGEDDLAASLEVAVQTLLVAKRNILLPLEQRVRALERLAVAALRIRLAQLDVELGVFLAELANRLLRALLITRVAAVQMIEA